jgi:hypothetical protein
MSTSFVAHSHRGSSASQVVITRKWENAAVIYGIVLVTLAQMPVFDSTTLGAVIRYSEIAFALILVGQNFQLVSRRFSGGEATFVLGYLAILLISTLAGTFAGTNPEPAELLKRVTVDLSIYSSAKVIVSEEAVERYVRWFTYVCLFAAIQAVPAVIANFFDVRGLHDIRITSLSEGGHVLSWWGLLGAGTNNYRADFYFSEASYFAQMLIPGIVYALTRRRGLWLVILLVGFVLTSAAAVGAALCVVMLIAATRFRLNSRLLVAMGIFAAIVGAALIVLLNSRAAFLISLFDRKGSIENKLASFNYIFLQLQRYPFGLGPVNLPEFFGRSITAVNSANGILDVAAHYGFLGLALALGLLLCLLYLVLSRREDWRVSALALGSFGIFISTVTHGPFIKYYALFMCSAAFSLRTTLLQGRKRLPGPGVGTEAKSSVPSP